MKFQNFGSHTPPKSDVQNFCPLKLVFLGLKFGQNHVFCQFWLYLLPPMVYMVGKPRVSASFWHQGIEILCILQAVRISGTHPDRLLNSSWHCVLASWATWRLLSICVHLNQSSPCLAFDPLTPLIKICRKKKNKPLQLSCGHYLLKTGGNYQPSLSKNYWLEFAIIDH